MHSPIQDIFRRLKSPIQDIFRRLKGFIADLHGGFSHPETTELSHLNATNLI